MQQFVDNRYRLQQPLGSGGMADVFLAHDDILDRDVALKVMSTRYAGDDEFVERFRREAQSAAALSHPNIVSIFDRGESDDGTYYIAMEYLSGGTLKDRILKRGAFPPRTAAAVALQIAEALRAAHERDVIHRDIKPHNILITDSGDVKVTDFGIARAASSSTMTRTGHILGTAHYISPEQAMGEPVGPASDLYSLGVVLYEMLTGEMPFDADTPLGIAMKHVNGHLVPPQVLNPEVPDGINAITVRLLAKDPKDRYPNDSELIEDLERVIAGLDPTGATTEMATQSMPAARAEPRPRRPERTKRRRRRATPMILALLALLILAPLAYAGYYLVRGLQQPEPAAMISVPNLVGMDVDVAEQTYGDDFEIKTTKESDGEDQVGTILSQDPESGGEARERSTISVEVVGTQVADVPNVIGDERDAAESALEDAGFEVSVEEQESSFEEEGLVTSQDPGEGSTVEAGSEVKITIGTGPDTVEVPNVIGNNPDQAAEILEGRGLELGSQNEDYSSEILAGAIMFQDPAEGESVEPGSEVNVTVSLGVQQVEVPPVYGATLAEAQGILDGAGLAYAPLEVPGDEPAGTALETDPGAGALLDLGSTVTLYYSAGPEPTTVDPDASPDPDQGGNENGGNGNSGSGNGGGGNSGNGNGGGRPGRGGNANLPENVQENVPGVGRRGRGNGGGED